FLADRTSISEKIQAFKYAFFSPENNVSVQPSATFYTHLNERGSLILTSEQPEYYIDLATRQVQLMLRVINKGLVPVNFRIEVSTGHDDIELVGETLSINLKPGSQELMPFTAVLRTKNRS